MSIAPIEDVPQEIADAFVIDTDIHYSPRPPEILPYVDDPLAREKLEKIAGSPISSAQGFTQHSQTFHPEIAVRGEPMTLTDFIRTGEDVVEAAATMGVDMPIIAPELFFLSCSPYPVLTGAIVSAYNDRVLDDMVTADENVRAWALLPQWSPDAMVEELDRIGTESAFVGAYTHFEHVHKAFGATEFDPVFEKLVELDMPLAIHGGRASRHDTADGDSVRTFAEGMGVHWAATAMHYMANMINTGVFDKYPDLQVLIQEPGFTWAPFLAQHLDEVITKFPEDIKITPRMHEMGREYLERDPGEYVFENFYFDTQPFSLTTEPRHAEALLEMCRADTRLTFSSDWPHPSMDMPWRVSEHPAVDADLRDRIFDGNTRDLLRL